jgi:ribosomal protein S21
MSMVQGKMAQEKFRPSIGSFNIINSFNAASTQVEKTEFDTTMASQAWSRSLGVSSLSGLYCKPWSRSPSILLRASILSKSAVYLPNGRTNLRPFSNSILLRTDEKKEPVDEHQKLIDEIYNKGRRNLASVDGQPASAAAEVEKGHRNWLQQQRSRQLLSNLANADSSLKPVDPANLQPIEPAPLSIGLGPTTGRSIEIGNGPNTDLARCLRQLGGVVNREKIRLDSRNQRFYERPGLKRKRLRRERWRRKFKVGFGELLAKVQDMRRNGW